MSAVPSRAYCSDRQSLHGGGPVIQHIAGDPALHKDGCDIIFMVEMLDNYGETC